MIRSIVRGPPSPSCAAPRRGPVPAPPAVRRGPAPALPLVPVLLVTALAALPAAAQERGVAAEDYYRMTFVGDVALAPSGELVAFTVTRVLEDENRRQREVWMAPLRDGAPAGEPFRFTDPTRDASDPRWSPDGSVVSFQSKRDDGVTTWFARVRAPGGEAYRIPGVEGAPIWSPDGRWIAYVKRPGEEEAGERDRRAGWIAPDAVTETANRERFDGRVITHPRYKADGTHPLLPHPGSRPKSQLFVVPAEGGEARQLTGSAFDVGSPEWSPDGRWIVFTGNERADTDPFTPASDVFLVAADGEGEVRRLTSGSGASRAPAFSPDGRRLAFLFTPEPTDPTRLQVVDLSPDGTFQGEPRSLADDWDLSPGSPGWRADGGAIRFTTQARGSAHLFEVPVDGGGAVRAVTAGERQVGSLSATPDGGLLAYTSTDAVTPAEVFVARGDGSQERRVTSLNDAWLAEVVRKAPERITWTVSDGTEVEGWLIPPVDLEPGRRYPMVLKIHGGPHGMYGHTFFQTFHVLSSAGFFVLYPNPRGSSGYGHAFMFATRGEWGLVDEEDFVKGVDAALARRPEIDPDRVGVSGGSYGGYATNWLTARTHRFAAAVTSRSIASLETLYGTTDIAGALDQEFFGPPWEEAERYRAASPMTYVGNVTAPTLIIHSEEDHRTPMQDGEMWYRALNRMGVPAEFVRYPRSSHGLSRTGEPWLLVDRLVRVRSWFEHWLAPEAARAADDRGR